MALTYLNPQMIEVPLVVPTLSTNAIQSSLFTADNITVTNLTSVNVSATDIFANNIYVSSTNKNLSSSLSWSISAPTLSSDPGTAGDIAYDLNFFYIAVSADTWKRVALTFF